MSDLPSCTSSSTSDLSSGAEEGAPAAKRQRRDWKLIDSERSFKEEWRKEFFVIPHPTNNHQCLCLICRTIFTQLKTHTIKRHVESKHKSLIELPTEAKAGKYERLLAAYEKERSSIVASTNIGRKQLLATYKLAWIICQKKHPFSAAEDFMEFARLADPDSPVFTGAPDSRRTITRRSEDLADYILRAELLPSIHQSPYFCLMLDDSLDKATHEQCLMMVRYIDVSTTEVISKFLSIVRIQGTPDAKTIFEAVNQRAIDLGLPVDKLICITTDGASVMQGSRNSVTKYILEKWNSLAFKQHCVIHKEVLGVKAALKELPSSVEESVKSSRIFQI